MRRPSQILAVVTFFCACVVNTPGQSAGGVVGAASSINYPPVAFPQLVQLSGFDSITLTLGAVDIVGNSVTFTLASDPLFGSITTFDSVSGQVVYTPHAGSSTADTFTFYASDGIHISDTVAVTILAPLGTSTASPSSLNFGNQGVGNTSTSKNVAVKNTGTNPITITTLTMTGTNSTDFAFTSATLPITLQSNKSTTIPVAFTPLALGSRSSSLVITSNASTSPQTIALSGVGVAQVTVSPGAIAFGNQGILLPSAPKIINVTNNDSTTLTGISIEISSDYTETDTCSISLPAKGKCTISIVFTPSVLGPSNGSVTITDSATNSPQSVSLSGAGIEPVGLSPGTISFSKQKVGTTSAPKSATLTNNTNTILAITGIVASGDYSFTTTCGSSLPAHGKCTISITFVPTASGTRVGSVMVSDSASTSPQVVNLTGTGS